MTQIDIDAEWQKLCEEHDAARDACFRAFPAANRKFTSIDQGTSHTNPTDDELSKSEKTCQKWEDIKCRMLDFRKKHA